MINQHRLLDKIRRAFPVVVKQHDFFRRRQHLRTLHHTAPVGIHHNGKRFFLHQLHSVRVLHQPRFIMPCLRHIFIQPFYPNADFIHNNPAFFAHCLSNGADAHAGAEAVQVRMAVSHHEDVGRFTHQLPKRISLYTCADTGVPPHLPCFSAVEQIFFAFFNQHLVAAASQCQIKSSFRVAHCRFQ